MAEQFANLAQTTLSGSMNGVVATLPATSNTGFPGAAQYRVRVDSEIMIVTAGAGTNTWTVTRGAEGTTATSHSSGAAVYHVLTAGALGGQSDATAATPSLRSLGTGAQQAMPGTPAANSIAPAAITAGSNGQILTTSGTATVWGSSAGGTNAFLNVKDFGAVGNASTDDTAAIQSAINAVSNLSTARGGTVFFPPGVYLCNSGLSLTTTSNKCVKLLGAGSTGQSNAAGQGSSILKFAAGVTPGITWYTNGANNFQGINIQDMEIWGLGGAASLNSEIGLQLNGCSNAYLSNVTVHDFVTGIQMNGTNATQDNYLFGVNINACHVGLDINNVNEVKLFGGMFLGPAGAAGTPTTGDYAIDIDNNADTFYLYGTSIKGWDIGVNIQDDASSNPANPMFFAPRFEGFNTGLYIGNNCHGAHVYGGNYNNSAKSGPGSSGTAVSVGSGCKGTMVSISNILNVTTKILDNGAVNPTYLVDGSFAPGWGSRQYYVAGTGTITDSTFTNAGLPVGNGQIAVTDNKIWSRGGGTWRSVTIA